ncbi:MAG: LptF/LptG family permease [Rickettsiales bacterium]|jgi:lipopolysaccharide export system permease protein|nr:LptF/LptG family permease [Rickettsiales bacterium]
MFLYEKNIYKNLFFPFLLITFAICGIAWIVQSIRYLEIILSQGARILDFISLTICLIPLLLFIILPVSLFFTVLYVYKKFLYDSEIIALYSLGITRIDIVKPFMKFSVFVAIMHLLISFYILPISSNKFKNLKFSINQNSIVNLIQFNTFISKIAGLTIFIEKKEGDNLLKNILINNSKNADRDITFIASSGKFYYDKTVYKLILYDGTKLEFQNDKQRYSMIKFSEFTVDLNQGEKSNGKLIDDSYELTVPELLFSNNIPNNRLEKFRAQGNFRLIWPLSSISITISALYFLTRREESRMRNFKWSFYTFLSVISIIGFNLSFYIFNRISYKYYLVVYMFNIILPLILYYKLYENNEKKLALISEEI